MRAPAVVVQALIGVTFPKRLIRPIPAVTFLIAHLLHTNALSAAAFKPGWALTVGRIHAANLIAHVPAVILMVALQAPMDASTIAAFKLVRRTGDTRAVSFI